MTGIPSIVAGLFALALFVLIVGPEIRLGFGGSVALSLLMIPIVVRSAEEMLRLVPDDLREASYALGVPKWRTIVKVVLPTALGGIFTGVALAISRVIGEPRAAGGRRLPPTRSTPTRFRGRMMTLPVYIFLPYATACRSTTEGPPASCLGWRAGSDRHRHAAGTSWPASSAGSSLPPRSAERAYAMARASTSPTSTSTTATSSRAGVNMTIKSRVTAFIGPSGCGKSTFLRSAQPDARGHPGRPRRGQRSSSTGHDLHGRSPTRSPYAARSAWSSSGPTRSRRCRSTTTCSPATG